MKVEQKYKYDEFDGDDMNYDRFLEQMPAMKNVYEITVLDKVSLLIYMSASVKIPGVALNH